MIVAHSPIQWLSESDRYFLGHWDHVAVAHMEKLAVGLSDRLICLSKNILSWMKSHSWKLPDIVNTLPPLAPEQWRLRTDVQTKRAITERCDEIALLGGPDYRDGLTLFCDAVDELAKTDIERVKLTAFGPFAQYLGEHTGGMLLRRARRWPFDVQIIPRLEYREILEYLSVNRVLAVVQDLGVSVSA